MTDISGYYIQQKGWYKIGAYTGKTVNEVWNDCLHAGSYRDVPDSLRLNRVFVVDMDSTQHSILPQDLRLHPAHEHRDSYNVVVRGEPHFQNDHYGEILEEYWGGNNSFNVPVGLWIYVIDEPTTVIYVKAVNLEFKFYYSHTGNNESEISSLVLEVDKQYTFRRVINDDGSHPFFLGDTDEITDPDNEGWRASDSSNIEVTTPAGYATNESGITTWESVGLRIDPSFIESPGNKLWYYCTTHSSMVFEFDVSGLAQVDNIAPTITIDPPDLTYNIVQNSQVMPNPTASSADNDGNPISIAYEGDWNSYSSSSANPGTYIIRYNTKDDAQNSAPEVQVIINVLADNIHPTMEIKVNGSTGPITNTDDSITLNFTISEEITGFDKNDIEVYQGIFPYSVSNLTNFTQINSATDPFYSYQAILNATAAAVYTVKVPSGKYQDINGNLNLADSNTFQWTKQSAFSGVTLEIAPNPANNTTSFNLISGSSVSTNTKFLSAMRVRWPVANRQSNLSNLSELTQNSGNNVAWQNVTPATNPFMLNVQQPLASPIALLTTLTPWFTIDAVVDNTIPVDTAFSYLKLTDTVGGSVTELTEAAGTFRIIYV
tara:strand:- start:929 stop:2734 length:1806 start_codon:yes stop_codon:yes gene_type:complete